MTNNWADIANATLVVAWGANPVENHPACAAHINRARFPKDFFPVGDTRRNKKEADLIVVDPRLSRTALQVDPNRAGDRYVRIRPGTDIALINGVIKYIIDEMESGTSDVPAAVKTKQFAYLNQGATDGALQSFYSNRVAGAGFASTLAGGVKYGSKYSDARFIVNAAGDDYEREDVGLTGDALVGGETANQIIYNFPKKATACDAAGVRTVYNRLKAHVAAYDFETVEDICGCTQADIAFIGDAYIANSRCSSSGALGASEDPRDPGYRSTTMLYAMGITQHTYGAQNVKSFAVLQTLMGNMGRAGGGINALRGIHNVQGSTDMGLLYGNIPAYSSNPGTQVDAIGVANNNAFGKYMDNLWGNPLSGTGSRTNMNASYDDAYTVGAQALQQRGFYNMTAKWFGDTSIIGDRTKTDACFALWPKGPGHNHVRMFREMALGNTTVAIVWGQNPAVTEPNQSKIREGLKRVKLLVVTDIFETETAAADRRVSGDYAEAIDGVTILLPSCSHVEKAGSAANSGRVLQWRQEARLPQGDTKDDSELLLRLAKALHTAGAFAHIEAMWTAYGVTAVDAYTQLYQTPYGGFNGTSGYNALAGVGDYVTPLGVSVDAPGTVNTAAALTGSEWVNESVFREMCAPQASYGTIWIYVEAYNTALGMTRLAALYSPWQVANRAKSRDNQDPYGTFGFHKWGYSWLVNRRVLYNNAEVPGDQTDYFMSAESQSRMFVPSNGPALLDYSRWYRTYHKLADVPVNDLGATPAVHVHPGKFPSHTEPYESPREDLVRAWGKNATTAANGQVPATAGSSYMNLLFPDTEWGTVADYPLVLTTIRCVEHFQGGPITRNNHWNVEIEPEPWIELNSADAFALGINDGDMVKIITARNDEDVTAAFVDDSIEAVYPRALYGEGFRARVGVGLQSRQRVAQGVVAIPWHWGDRGLSTGSRANDLCIDAGDANTYIPESKACLCKIEKM